MHAGEALDILHHGVAVFIAFDQAGEHEEGRIAHTITSHVVSYDVVTPVSRGFLVFLGPLGPALPGSAIRAQHLRPA